MAALFQTLDLDVHESEALFHLLDDGDGEVTLAEFIDGVMRCKGPARAIDQVAMHAEMKQLSRRFGKLLKQLKQQAAIPKKQNRNILRIPVWEVAKRLSAAGHLDLT